VRSDALNEDIEKFAGVIDGPPQPAALSIDDQTEFIEVPDVGACPSPAPQSSRVLRPEPQADGFVGDLNPSSEHQLGDVPQAHPEAVVEPHAPTDDRPRCHSSASPVTDVLSSLSDSFVAARATSLHAVKRFARIDSGSLLERIAIGSPYCGFQTRAGIRRSRLHGEVQSD
jgi:hypothetical protein